jgi:hypothetical protein
LGDPNAFIALALTLLVVRRALRLMPTARLVRKAEPLINLLTMLLVGALCTSFADIMSETLELQNSAGFLPLLAGLTCVAAAGVWTRLPTRLADPARRPTFFRPSATAGTRFARAGFGLIV